MTTFYPNSSLLGSKAMIHQRLDRGCNAQVLSVHGDEILLRAFWPSAEGDKRRFKVENGITTNFTCVSRSYFERRYGAQPNAS